MGVWHCQVCLALSSRSKSVFWPILQKPGEGLLVELDERRVGRPTSGAVVAAQWFAQDLFDKADLDEDEEPLPAASGKQAKAKQTAKAKAARQTQLAEQSQQPEASSAQAAAATAAADDGDAAARSEEDSDSSEQGASSSGEEDGDELPTAGPTTDATAQLMSKSGFEEVPISRRHAGSGAGSSDDSSDDGFDDLDDEGRAEVLALARKMLKGRERQDIMDGAYHRYAFHESGLPRWFEEDEARHMK